VPRCSGVQRRRNLVLAGVLVFALVGCAWWGLVVALAWAFRDFLICWGSPCLDRPAIVAQRTWAAVALSIWLVINLVAIVIFVVNRRHLGTRVLGGVEVVGLVITLVVGGNFVAAGDPLTATQWWSGSLIATAILGMLYLLNRAPGGVDA
jgi:hypothetical protein